MAHKAVFVGPVGRSVYMVLLSAEGQAWNGALFEDVVASNWASYAIPLVERAGCGVYLGTLPANLPPCVALTVEAYLQIGAVPSPTDTPGQDYRIDWFGAEFVGPSNARLNLTQAVPWVNDENTVGDALNSARAVGFGNWQFVGDEWRLYAPDGLTLVKTFQMNDPEGPTARL